MALFSCKVINEVGKEEKRIQEANDEKSLRVILKEQNLVLVKATKLKEKQPNLFLAVSSRVKPQEVILFLRQFSVMINSSTSISDALNALKQQNYSKPFKKVLMDVHNSVLSGMLLSEAFEKHPEVFPSFFVEMVAIGEVSSSLDSVLKSMADYYESNQRMKKKSRTAMVYPIMLFVMLFVVVVFLSFVILPQFADMFAAFDGTVPKITVAVLAISEFIRNNILYLITGIFGGVLLILLFFTTPPGQRVLDWLKIYTPIIGRVNKAIITARFTRAFIILLRSGMNITDCMDNLKRILGNSFYQDKFQYAIDEVKRGKKIAESIERTGLFPKMLTEMIAVGEKSGNLDEVLESTALFYDTQVESAISKATAALEPTMIILLGAVVALVLLSVYLPMIDMYNTI
ncbi:MAG: type II secretion system F family protein [Clostridia bacterium]|nr:type II secretion system F family protein [Clostridia bacterium]